jgi:hypothetical protein
MKQFIVITSIFPPTVGVKKYALLEGWNLIVVGDKKTPKDWAWDKVRFISTVDQEKSGYETARCLPWNHYARKMIGYLAAIKSGAEIIFDTDDDNIPKNDWGLPDSLNAYDLTPSDRSFVNVYRYFSDQPIWPRGFPLNHIMDKRTLLTDGDLKKQTVRVGIWQGLNDGDPDVDAIYRLTSNAACHFMGKDPLVLNQGTVCPFNSQNTAFVKTLFPLLYLPAFVNFRFTDILRGLVAQPIMWQAGYLLGFTKPSAIQKRNAHDFFDDFVSEVPCYLYAEKIVEIAEAAVRSKFSITENLMGVYENLCRHEIVTRKEPDLVQAWIRDIEEYL